MKKILLCIVLLIIATFVFFRFYKAQASGNIYYFNNAVNTSPLTLGNYWNDPAATSPALSLPDSLDEVTVLAGANYVGNALFIGGAVNQGTVTGNATFNEYATNEGIINGNASFDLYAINNGTVNGNGTFYNAETENLGTVSGIKTRYYNSSTTLTIDNRDFVTTGPWFLVADGIEIDISSATTDINTTITLLNGGTFIHVFFASSSAINRTVYLNYTKDLNPSGIPDSSDFIVRVNGSLASISGISVSGKSLIITLDNSVSLEDAVTVTYTPGTTPVNSNGINVPSMSGRTAGAGITVGKYPFTSVLIGTKLYVMNALEHTISVINTATDTIISTIPVGNYPEYVYYSAINNKLYVTHTTSNNIVTVINTLTDTVSSTITVGSEPLYPLVVGTTLYVPNRVGDSVSVINTNTDTVITTIPVGDMPYYATSVGNKVYIANRNSGTVSVISTATNTVTSTITVGSQPFSIIPVGTNLYVSNSNSDTVSVINSVTDAVTATIAVGDRPLFFSNIGTKLYVTNSFSDNVSVINTATNTVSATISVGDGPYYPTVFGTKIFVGNLFSYNVSVINSVTDTVSTTLTGMSGLSPYLQTVAGNKLYVNNAQQGNTLSVFNINTITSELPNLVSFSTTASDGVYSVGQQIPITATFGKNLHSGSTMTVLLNNGASVLLDSVGGNSLYGTYTIGSGQSTPDLSVSSVTSASVSDLLGHTRTSYSLPLSQGSLVAENSYITRNLGDTKNIVIGSYSGLLVGSKPYQISAPVTVNSIDYLYVANQGSDSVSVIRKSDMTVISTIPVGSEPYGLSTATVSSVVYVYVANTGSNTVSVINTATNAVVATISVGVKPYYVATIGTTVYATNSLSNTVSVINAATNTVSATIPVGSYPRGIKPYTTFLYVANYGDANFGGGNSISVINSATNTVTATIMLPAGSSGPRGVAVLGTKVYVANYRSNNISVINTATNTVTNTITVGAGPRGIIGLGTNIYVENFDDGTISIIDTGTNAVTLTVVVGHSPAGMSVDGTDIYVTRFQDDTVSVLNTSTGLLRADTIAPIISSVSYAHNNFSTTTVSWTTDEVADSLVEYGLTVDYGDFSNHLTSYSTAHSRALVGLDPGKTYHYRVISVDQWGNTATSSDYTFTTQSSGGIGIITPGPLPIEILPEEVEPTQGNSTQDSEIIVPTESVSFGKQCDAVINRRSETTLVSRLKGLFLLAVEDRGKLWYVSPDSGYRYQVNSEKALELFRCLSLGITNEDLGDIAVSGSSTKKTSLAERLKGKLLLQVENRGEIWYVDSQSYRNQLTHSNIVSVAKKFALGVTNQVLSLINTKPEN